mmetsp:Transcript_15139/g.35008  ORF Transcript_15139/g.35008 Transcript_15139/m.35008 type:complete len:173 (+) Transcript_15139:605-1123(+)
MHAKRRGDLGKRPSSVEVQSGTARAALDHVAATFVEHNRPNPILDSRGKVHQHIRRQTAGYKRSDPPKKHENQHVTKLTRTDVKNGYAVPITAKGVRRFKDAEVHPAGLQHQNTTHVRLCLTTQTTNYKFDHTTPQGRLINEGGGNSRGDSGMSPVAWIGPEMATRPLCRRI